MTFYGGKGNDVYLTRVANDSVHRAMDPASLGGIAVVEQPGEGIDTYRSGFWSAQLPANVENLVLIAPNPVSNVNLRFDGGGPNDFSHKLIGNALANTIDATLYEDQLYSQWWYSYSSFPLSGAASFRLDGGAGADTLIGGVGDDTYVIDSLSDVIVENGVNKGGYDYSKDTVETPFETALSQYPHIENVTLVGSAPVGATGTAGSNRLDGSQNSASNRLSGGLGNDTYMVGAGDTVVEQPGEGFDTVIVAATSGTIVRLSDFPNVENLRLAGALGNVDAEGDAAANVLTGSLGDNVLSGGDGDDLLYDQASEDTRGYYSWSLRGRRRRAARRCGQRLVDHVRRQRHARRRQRRRQPRGRGPTPQLDVKTIRFGPGDGHDTLYRGYGSAPVHDVVEFKSGIGITDVQATAQSGELLLTLPDGSSLRLPGAVDIGQPGAPAHRIRSDARGFRTASRSAPPRSKPCLGSPDRSTPTESGDLLYGTAAADVIAALGGDDGVFGGAGNDSLDGGAGNDGVYGGAGADTLIGGTGNDLLAGGSAADVYRFSRGFGIDVIDDLLGATAGVDDGAIDAVEFDATIAVADVAVYRRVDGSTPIGLVLGVPATQDTVELAHTYTAGTAGAIETVRFASGTTWDLAALKARIAGEVGGTANDTLTGGAGADVLDGRGGGDVMTGLGGDDTYYVDSASDQVIEASTAGTDSVYSSISYGLPLNVERLVLTGSASLGIGNGQNNVLTGNAYANRLDGGAGSDTMIGGAGDDTYVVDASGDVVTEQFGEGIDTIESSVTVIKLPDNVENLTLTGSGKISGTGNALDNVLTGNGAVNTLNGGLGNDRLDGGLGADAMTGGAGDDVYIVDNTSDKTTELAAGGFDTVLSSVTLTLATEIERLFLTGSAALNGTGNTSANWLVGNDASNTLNGGAGADLLMGLGGTDTLVDTAGNNAFDGGAQDDTLTGGSGNDLFAGGRGISATVTLGGGADTICLNAGDGSTLVAAPTSTSGAGERNDTLSIGKARLDQLTFTPVERCRSRSGDRPGRHERRPGPPEGLVHVGAEPDGDAPASGSSTRAANTRRGLPMSCARSRIDTLDFVRLTAAFDAARAANPSLQSWKPTAQRPRRRAARRERQRRASAACSPTPMRTTAACRTSATPTRSVSWALSALVRPRRRSSAARVSRAAGSRRLSAPAGAARCALTTQKRRRLRCGIPGFAFNRRRHRLRGRLPHPADGLRTGIHRPDRQRHGRADVAIDRALRGLERSRRRIARARLTRRTRSPTPRPSLPGAPAPSAGVAPSPRSLPASPRAPRFTRHGHRCWRRGSGTRGCERGSACGRLRQPHRRQRLDGRPGHLVAVNRRRPCPPALPRRRRSDAIADGPLFPRRRCCALAMAPLTEDDGAAPPGADRACPEPRSHAVGCRRRVERAAAGQRRVRHRADLLARRRGARLRCHRRRAARCRRAGVAGAAPGSRRDVPPGPVVVMRRAPPRRPPELSRPVPTPAAGLAATTRLAGPRARPRTRARPAGVRRSGRYRGRARPRGASVPAAHRAGHAARTGRRARDARARARRLQPDVIVAHPGWGESLYAKDVYPDARIVHFCEWYYAAHGADLGFDPDFPAPSMISARVRTWNALHALNLLQCDAGVSPTRWQRSRHPEALQPKIACSTRASRSNGSGPDPNACLATPGGALLRSGDPVVTYVARNLEPYRGFHVFMRALERLQAEEPQGARRDRRRRRRQLRRAAAPTRPTGASACCARCGSTPTRTHFLGRVPYETYVRALQVSAAHVYLSYPFVLSWSLLEAMACGALVVGSDTGAGARDGARRRERPAGAVLRRCSAGRGAARSPRRAGCLRAAAQARPARHGALQPASGPRGL